MNDIGKTGICRRSSATVRRSQPNRDLAPVMLFGSAQHSLSTLSGREFHVEAASC